MGLSLFVEGALHLENLERGLGKTFLLFRGEEDKSARHRPFEEKRE